MSQPESRIVTAVLQRIRDLGGHAVKTHPAGGTAGTPDVLGTHNGRALALEVKRPHTRNNTTPQQRHQLELWKKAGAIAGVVCTADEAEALLTTTPTRFGHASAVLDILNGRRINATDDRPLLVPLDAIDAIEATMRCNQDSHGDRWRTRPVHHHVRKAFGHALSGEQHGHALDDDTGLPHLTLAATRLVLAVGVLLDPTDRQDAQ